MVAMSADGGLVSIADLEERWKPPGPTPRARRVWVQRQVEKLGLRPAIPGRSNTVRFRFASVLAAEEKREGRRACYA